MTGATVLSSADDGRSSNRDAGAGYRTATKALSRDLNRAAVFRLIGAAGPIARSQIARQLGLSPATVTAVTRELLDEGLVRVAQHAPSRGGRPAVLLELDGSAATAFGFKIAADHVVGVRVDIEADVLDRFELPFDATSPGAIERLGELLSRILAENTDGPPLLGVGLGVPGVFDTRTGRLDSPLFGWRDVALADVLQRDLGVPVFVENDVNTLAVAERLYGRGRDVEHFVTVTIGRGIGLGIIADGDIYRGFRGGAGEFGHTTVVDDGPTCTCGKRGCLEALVSDPALVAQARAAGVLTRRQTIDRLRDLASAGDERASAIYAQAGAVLGRSVGNLVNIFGPELVLISGEGTQAWPQLEPAFDDAFRACVFPPLGDVPVEVDPWDDARWAVGAATVVLRATFTAPLEDDPYATREGVRFPAEVVG
jgi:predicted NBD/HSP70 family sugar kinase